MHSRTETEPPPPAAPSREALSAPARTTRSRARPTPVSHGFELGPPPLDDPFDVRSLESPGRRSGWSRWSESDDRAARRAGEPPSALRSPAAAPSLVRCLSLADDGARIAPGPSAGRHRSAVPVTELAKPLAEEGIECAVEHRALKNQ